MSRNIHSRPMLLIITALALIPLLGACSNVYYGAWEKMGVHKRDILVSRVEKARDSQADAQEQFKSALEQFDSVVRLKDTDLKRAYENMNGAYQDSKNAADEVTSQIDNVESVADALFEEWEKELELYENAELRRESKKQIDATRSRYGKMLSAMHQAEKSMHPVLRTFYDNVLFLKHNLNAQAIGSLRGEFSTLQGKIDGLIKQMNAAIASSNQFIAGLK